MSFARVASVLKGVGGSVVTIGAGGVLGYLFYKKALEDIREVVEESKEIMCGSEKTPYLVVVDQEGNTIGRLSPPEYVDRLSIFDEDESREAAGESEKCKKSAGIILRGSMMLLGLALSIYMMAEEGERLYQFIESFDPGVAGQQVLAATVTGVTLTLLPAISVSVATPVAKIVEASVSKLSYCANYASLKLSYYANHASSFFRNEKEYKKNDDSLDGNMELVPLMPKRRASCVDSV